MNYKKYFNGLALAGGIFAMAAQAFAHDGYNPTSSSGPHPSAAATTTAASTASAQNTISIDIDLNMKLPTSKYATGNYIAYVIHKDRSINLLAAEALRNLAIETQKQISIEIDGVVGVDLEKDDLSNFQFLYWPVTEQTGRLSPAAKNNIREFKNHSGEIAIDVVDGRNLRTSTTLRGVLEDAQVRPVEILNSEHTLTHSFCITDNLSGAVDNEVLVERVSPDARSSDMSAFIIGAQNWAEAWRGQNVGPETYKKAICSGFNMLFYSYAGEASDQLWMEEIIKEKREQIQMNKLWDAERELQQKQQAPAPE